MQWKKMQYRYAVRQETLEESKNWKSWLIKYMANQAFTLWTCRNRHKHGNDSRSQHLGYNPMTDREGSNGTYMIFPRPSGITGVGQCDPNLHTIHL